MKDNQQSFAIHLAAGRGSRLMPITNNKPKPLVELGEQSLLSRNWETLRAAGVDDQIAVTGYEAEVIEKRGFETVHNPSYEETEMIYSLFRAESAFPSDGNLLISYGDIVYERQLVDQLLETTTPITIVVDESWRQLWEKRFQDPLDDAETLQTTQDGRLTEIGGSPTSDDEIPAQFIGLLALDQEGIETATDAYYEFSIDRRKSIETTEFLQYLVDRGAEIGTVSVSRGWLEVDTVSDFNCYQEWIKSGKIQQHLDLSW